MKISSILSVVFLILSIILVSIIGYYYQHYVFIEKKDFDKYKLVDEISFDDLPIFEKERYILLNECQKEPKIVTKTIVKEKKVYITKQDDTKIKQLQNTINKLKNQLSKQKTNKIVVKEKYFNKFNYIKCNDFKNTQITNRCIKKIVSFIDKKYKFYEIVPIVSKIEQVKYDNIKLQGIEKQRASEAVWEIKKRVGQNFKVFIANYKIVTPTNKGVIIRGYY